MKCKECDGEGGYWFIFGSGCGGDEYIKCKKCKGSGKQDEDNSSIREEDIKKT